ncbi:MAG: carboxypeptidase regulatory-like domain-containing protein [Candidatus Nealsonbacteria bacterium]|nr:carboxypeptidase regulatory-like domain-containing protein [Candidatus Nealsonbacteria bacterium]
MRNATFLQWVAVVMAMVGVCFPQMVLGANPATKPAPVVTDVKLNSGVLLGQVLDAQGKPLAGVPVSLSSGGRELIGGKAAPRTDANGLFSFRGLSNSGVYQVAAAEGQGTFRVWPERIAPPSAQPGALVVAGGQTQRGQFGLLGFRNLLSNPWVVATLIAAAIAVPVAIHNSNNSPSS